MNRPQEQEPKEAERGDHLLQEDDIGSGEKTPGEKETEEAIRSIPPQPATQPPAKP